MAKKVATILKLQIPAGAANPSPPVGPALGQAAVNIMDFCNAFNSETQNMEKGLPLPVVITVYEDKSFTFQVKSAPASNTLPLTSTFPPKVATPTTFNDVAVVDVDTRRSIK